MKVLLIKKACIKNKVYMKEFAYNIMVKTVTEKHCFKIHYNRKEYNYYPLKGKLQNYKNAREHDFFIKGVG